MRPIPKKASGEYFREKLFRETDREYVIGYFRTLSSEIIQKANLCHLIESTIERF